MQTLVAQTVQGMGYDLVELERSAGGTVRVTIDHHWVPGQPERFIQVEDCEQVTRQLQYALDVDGVDYKRLEVSSPGIDRPLRNEADFARFVGQVIDITLRQPMGGQAAGLVAANRKKFRGTSARRCAPPRRSRPRLTRPDGRNEGQSAASASSASLESPLSIAATASL